MTHQMFVYITFASFCTGLLEMTIYLMAGNDMKYRIVTGDDRSSVPVEPYVFYVSLLIECLVSCASQVCLPIWSY